MKKNKGEKLIKSRKQLQAIPVFWRNHLRSDLGIICGRGSLAALSIVASDLSLITRLTSWNLREFSLSFVNWHALLSSFVFPAQMKLARVDNNLRSSRSFNRALLIVDKQAFFHFVDELNTTSFFSCRCLFPGDQLGKVRTAADSF